MVLTPWNDRMIHRTRGVVGATVICAALGSRAFDGQKAVAASSAWIKAPGTADGTATAFLVVDNPTMYDVYLVSAATELAEEVRFREPGAKGDSGGVLQVPAVVKP